MNPCRVIWERGCWRVREMVSHTTPAPIRLDIRAREHIKECSRSQVRVTELATIPASRNVGRKDRFHQRVLGPGGLKRLWSPLPLSLGKSLNSFQSLCPTASAPPSPSPSSCHAAQGHSPLGTSALLVTLGQGPDLKLGVWAESAPPVGDIASWKSCFKASGWPGTGREREVPCLEAGR